MVCIKKVYEIYKYKLRYVNILYSCVAFDLVYLGMCIS